MRRPLFKEFSEPFAVLVEAVKSEQPRIQADDVAADLVLLAQNCLVKAPDARLALVSWDDFERLSAPRQSVDSARERVRRRTLLARAQSPGTPSVRRLSAKQNAQRIVSHLDTIIRHECAGSDSFPPMQITPTVDGAAQVQVIFAASPDRALPHDLSVRFDCDLVDEATMAVSIAASACVLPAGASAGEPVAPVPVFRGPLDSSNLTGRVQEVLWIAIDLAQQHGNKPDLGSGPLWLELAQALEGQA